MKSGWKRPVPGVYRKGDYEVRREGSGGYQIWLVLHRGAEIGIESSKAEAEQRAERHMKEKLK